MARRCCWLLLVLAGLWLGAPPALAATSVVQESASVRIADPAVVPVNVGATGPDGYEPDDASTRATALRIGGLPQDHTISAGEQDWFQLATSDGTGFVRIGSTGELRVDYLLQQGDQPEQVEQLIGPHSGASLVEARIMPDIAYAAEMGVRTVYLVVETPSEGPVDYRISFTNQLPDDLLGAETPRLAAEQYLRGLLEGDLIALSTSGAARYSDEQARTLREQWFGRPDPIAGDVVLHESPKHSANEEFDSPVQHVVLSHLDEADGLSSWAFVVTCGQRDGWWVVTGVKKDPELTDAQVLAYVTAEYERMGTLTETTTTPRRVVRWSLVVAIVALVVLVVAAALVARRVRAVRRATRKSAPTLVAVFGQTTAWAGKTVLYVGEDFVLEDHGVISAADVMRYDREGHLVWSSQGTRAWVGAKAAGTSS
jgi:uncharacterized membrane protein YhaH (DUF805 family)